jgi:hypothetical protein
VPAEDLARVLKQRCLGKFLKKDSDNMAELSTSLVLKLNGMRR